ncbi:hypothetical protein G7Y89_g12414 [Cudoniella acicularis]|uniref:Class II aldolase/adducin N-terminal domain-containing protein n=1 Tax=Cudoniella acicularis TaxID=354080 RepID=A0A8H4VX16_9HELO|nr:hypothetical protein G7Y89_g12414 [Cudoniella acicularis]
MAPPSATHDELSSNTNTTLNPKTDKATLEPGLSKKEDASKLILPGSPTFTNKLEEREFQKGRLALAFRIFAKLGFDEGVAGHITLRDPIEPTSFWVNPFGVAWPLLKASDLILVNENGEVIDGGPCRLLNRADDRECGVLVYEFREVLSGAVDG